MWLESSNELAGAGYARLVRSEARLVLDLFERLFDHQSFTGRSGTFFGYEGLGCIYWHMVSKLLLAAQETFFRAADAGASATVLQTTRRMLLRHPRRHRRLKIARGLRRVSHGPLFAHAGVTPAPASRV